MDTPQKYKLLILESPAKAKTVSGYLKDQNFRVIASKGHIFELPKRDFGVDLNSFETTEVPIEGKEDTIKEIKRLAKDADEIYLGGDFDGEGEKICNDIKDLIQNSKNQKNIHRVVFTEITKKGILEGIKKLGSVDIEKCNAQKTRRILDRIVGYKISPILWNKLNSGNLTLSAGRVQSIALRFIVDLEKEIGAFIPEKFLQITAKLKKDNINFESKYFGESEDKKTDLTEDLAKKILTDIKEKQFIVSKIEMKERRQQPSPPFSTSRLQQESSNKLKFNAKKTMELAQNLFEGVSLGEKGNQGLITYHRTSSLSSSEEALTSVRNYIENLYGSNYLPPEPIIYKKKKSDENKKDPHESIRPTNMLNTPELVRPFLKDDQHKLYTLIWNKFVSSQMKDCILDQTNVLFDVSNHYFKSVGVVVKFDGFKAVYTDGDENKEDTDDGSLPKLDLKEELIPVAYPKLIEKFTSPPSRYNEGSLIKELEERGIGRSSTYATIVTTIVDRQYVAKKDNRFYPTEIGTTLCNFLIEHFPQEMEYDFTAELEKKLDLIEDGKLVWTDVLRDFWAGLSTTLEKVRINVKDAIQEGAARAIDPKRKTGISCETCKKGEYVIIESKKGKSFLGCSFYPSCKGVCDFKKSKSGQITIVKREEIFYRDPCPKCGEKLVLREGKFGKYYSCLGYTTGCKTTMPFTTGINCPDCKIGEFTKKSTKDGNTFYGCSSYPTCKNTISFRPVADPCKKCGYLVRGANKTKAGFELSCSKCKTREII